MTSRSARRVKPWPNRDLNVATNCPQDCQFANETVTPQAIDETIPNPLDAVCGWCRREVALQKMDAGHEVAYRDSGPGGRQTIRVSATYLCPRQSCNRPSLAFFDVVHDPVYDENFRFDELVGLVPAGSASEMDDLPPEIERDRQEAWSSFYAANFRAAVIMGRAAVQRAVRALEAEGATLRDEIEDLARMGKITATLSSYADEVRLAGNDAAHPEKLGDVTRNDARSSLEFADEFLRSAIAMPARAEAQRRAREETQQS